MTTIHGIIMFFIGVPLTVIGFFIAYTVASKTQKKPEELTEVQKSIKELTQSNIEKCSFYYQVTCRYQER